MTQAALDSYAMANGFGKTTAAMSEQEKVALRYRFVMEQLSAASGDFVRTSDGWANQMRLLSLQFEQLKATIGQGLINALTPVIKVINSILAGLQKLANAFAQFTELLFGKASSSGGAVQEEVAGIADGYGAAAEGAEDLAEGTEKAGKAAKKYLANFDEIQKIGDNATDAGDAVSGGLTGVGSVGVTIPVTADIEDNVSPQVAALAEKVKALIAPLREIDFAPLKESLGRLGDAFGNLGGTIGSALEWAWFNILVPFAQWTIEEAGPASVDLLASAFQFLDSVLDPVFVGLQQLMTWLMPVFEFIGTVAIDTLNWFSERFQDLAAVFEENGPEISGIISNIGEVLAFVWSKMEPILSQMATDWGKTFTFLADGVMIAIDAILKNLYGLTEFLTGVFTGDWERAWGGIETIFESAAELLVDTAEWILSAFGLTFEDLETILTDSINGIIGSINGMVSGVVSGINAVIRAMNKLQFDIPDWVPSFGGKTFGFDIPTIVAPQIPYLAKGAVIPPNAPFMAVLGDQRHGTNIEAPLSTIQEAVALVMDDYAAANLAGQEAIVAVLREILEAVLGIEIGDDVIGQALERYNRKRAVMGGS